MNIQDVLASNVQALIDASGMNENSFAAHHKLPKSNLRKMRLSEANMRMGTVNEVASALKLRACDLLDPDLARRAKAGEPLRMGEPRPPVMADAQWRALSPRTRAFVEDLCMQALTGTVSDNDIAWLHDSLNRASASHAARHGTPQVPPTTAHAQTDAQGPTTIDQVPGIAGQVLKKQLATESREVFKQRTKQ